MGWWAPHTPANSGGCLTPRDPTTTTAGLSPGVLPALLVLMLEKVLVLYSFSGYSQNLGVVEPMRIATDGAETQYW